MEKLEHEDSYQSFRYEIQTSQHRQVMEVSGYRAGDRTGSPLSYYVVTWPGPGISLPVPSTMLTVHIDLASQARFPVEELRFAFYATNGEQEFNYPYIDTAGFVSLAVNLLQKEPDFLRIDGTFFSVAMERAQGAARPPMNCFFSFFNLYKFIYGIYAISSRDIATAPGRSLIEADLEHILDQGNFPSFTNINEFKEKISELQKSY